MQNFGTLQKLDKTLGIFTRSLRDTGGLDKFHIKSILCGSLVTVKGSWFGKGPEVPIQCRPETDRPSELTPESTKKSRNEVLPEKTCSVDWVKSIVIFTERRFKKILQKKIIQKINSRNIKVKSKIQTTSHTRSHRG